MRILMLSQFYPPIIGGGAIHAQSLSIELAARGHDVAVVTLRHEGQPAFEMDRGVRVYRIRSSSQRVPGLFSDNRRHYAAPFPDPETTLALRRLIMSERPQIVHAHNWLVYSFLPLKAWSKARLVVTLHNYNLVCVKTTLLRHNKLCDGPGLIKCLDCASAFYGPAKGVPIVLAHRLLSLRKRGLVDMFLPVSRATASGNGLIGSDLPFQIIPNFMPDDLNILQGDAEFYLTQLPAEDYLLFVGALDRQKGVDVLLRAYADLPYAPPLVLIGYQTRDWPALAVDCPANVFVFKDWPRFAVMKAWQRSMMALQPSVGPETFGIAVMEAMSTGRPVIASRIGGLTDLVTDGETGFLVQPGDALALRTAMEQLLANPDLQRCMGQAALRKVASFQASVVVPRIERIYEELLQKRGGVEVESIKGNMV